MRLCQEHECMRPIIDQGGLWDLPTIMPQYEKIAGGLKSYKVK